MVPRGRETRDDKRMKKIEWIEIQHTLEIAFEKIGEPKTKLYYELLKHLDGELVALGVKKLLVERVWSKFPTVGDISQAVADLRLGALPSPTQAWGETRTAVVRFGNNRVWIDKKTGRTVWDGGDDREMKDSFDEAIASLSPTVGKFLESCGREYYVQLCDELNHGFSQHIFEKSYAEFRVKIVQDIIALPAVTEQKRISVGNKIKHK